MMDQRTPKRLPHQIPCRNPRLAYSQVAAPVQQKKERIVDRIFLGNFSIFGGAIESIW
jgi:hypothetical protein